MGSKISNTEWGLVIGAGVVLDLVQWLLDAFVVGLFINPFIDIGIGMALPFYFYMRGIKPDSKKVLAWVGSGLIEALTAGAIPLWTADIVVTMILDKLDKKMAKVMGKQPEANQSGQQGNAGLKESA